eukprot:scaffold2.g7190.t1
MFDSLVLFTSGYELYVLLLSAAIQLAVLLSLLVSLDRILNVTKFAACRLWARATGRLPKDRWHFQPLPEDPALWPLVAVQLPMFNERAVCQAIIDCCAELEWPAKRLKIQVLDDSTDKITRELVLEWRERGVNVECLRRTNRQGYKAGAMKEGMEALAKEGYRYVAVFDADFKPEPNFLLRTIPYLEGNPEVGFVQSRWVFTNPEESYLTKAQEISLNYHMKCEQYTHSASGSFFNFNGTAGIWRQACIESAGGWNSRTTVEDMDLSLRAYLKGWKAIFLDDLPASFFAYRKQQHRWTCGPIQLWSRTSADIWASALPLGRKLELSLAYFGVRKCATHFVSLGFFCTLVPLSVFTPEVHIAAWALLHLPVAVTLSTAAFTRRGWLYCILYVLFENAMGTVKLWAVVTGLLDLQRAQEWVVTTKLGSSDKRPGTGGSPGLAVPSCKARHCARGRLLRCIPCPGLLYLSELAMGLFTMAAGLWGLFSGHHWGMCAYLLLQARARVAGRWLCALGQRRAQTGGVFLAFGFNMVDVGGLLGGRLDEGLFKAPAAAALDTGGEAGVGAKTEVKRAVTIPVINVSSTDRVVLGSPPAAGIGFHKSASVSLARLATPRSLGILDQSQQAPSPAHSSASSSSLGPFAPGSRTPDSEVEAGFASASSAASDSASALSVSCGGRAGALQPVKLEGSTRWPSPTSSLANIYAGAVSSLRRGYKYSERRSGGGYGTPSLHQAGLQFGPSSLTMAFKTAARPLRDFLTLLIPTTGRATLHRTLDSLINQTMPRSWRALVLVDGPPRYGAVTPSPLLDDPRVRVFFMEKQLYRGPVLDNNAGGLRNLGIKIARTPWASAAWGRGSHVQRVAMVDDDDTLHPRYVERLLYETQQHPEAELVDFRMFLNDYVEPGNGTRGAFIGMGISFAMRRATCLNGYFFVPDW